MKPNVPYMHRAFVTDCEVRAVNVESRTATFVAATENGVETWDGREHLAMKGADLKRYKRNPVILDSHNRFEASAVIGKATVEARDDKLMADVTFAETERAESVWQLVKGGFIKAVSVGFMPREVKTIGEGETFKLGDRAVEGPARIVRKWELYEISIVPVPADADALRRTLLDESVLGILAQLPGRAQQENTAMADENKAVPAEGTTDKPEVRQVQTPPVAAPTEAPETRALRERNEQVLLCTPPELASFARGLLMDVKLTREAALDQIKKKWAELMPTSGHAEPAAPVTERQANAPKVADVPADVLVRGLCG